VTTGNPPDVFAHVTKVLEGMGVEFHKETEFKYRCIRPKRRKSVIIGSSGSSATLANSGSVSGMSLRDPVVGASGLNAYTMVGSASSSGVDKRGLPLPPSNSYSSPAGMLRGLWTRRGSSQVSGPIVGGSMTVYDSDDLVIVGPSSTSSLTHTSEPVQLPATAPPPTTGAREPVYGDRSNDQFDEVRFSVELTRIDRLEDTLSLDIRRLKGNLRSYKFLYDTLRERCNFT